MTGRVAGKVAVITGAAGAFGQVMVGLFVEEGAHVVACDLPGTALAELAARHGDAVRTVEHNVLVEEDWVRVVGVAKSAFGKLDILVNNAGVSQTGQPQDPEHVKLDQWRAVNSVNVEGVLLGCQAAIRAMKERGGAIVNISSIAALNPSPKMIAYGASKAAVRHMTRTVAAYCAQQGYNIRCNSIHPGWFLTKLVLDSRTPAELEAQEKLIPLRRFGQVMDVARATLFLASDEAQYMTGAKVVVDGGVTMEP
jgi:NAD(P)-dependent dehydrogenase (short-subunit alcohol dehydrogenase family)